MIRTRPVIQTSTERSVCAVSKGPEVAYHVSKPVMPDVRMRSGIISSSARSPRDDWSRGWLGMPSCLKLYSGILTISRQSRAQSRHVVAQRAIRSSPAKVSQSFARASQS